MFCAHLPEMVALLPWTTQHSESGGPRLPRAGSGSVAAASNDRAPNLTWLCFAAPFMPIVE